MTTINLTALQSGLDIKLVDEPLIGQQVNLTLALRNDTAIAVEISSLYLEKAEEGCPWDSFRLLPLERPPHEIGVGKEFCVPVCFQPRAATRHQAKLVAIVGGEAGRLTITGTGRPPRRGDIYYADISPEVDNPQPHVFTRIHGRHFVMVVSADEANNGGPSPYRVTVVPFTSNTNDNRPGFRVDSGEGGLERQGTLLPQFLTLRAEIRSGPDALLTPPR